MCSTSDGDANAKRGGGRSTLSRACAASACPPACLGTLAVGLVGQHVLHSLERLLRPAGEGVLGDPELPGRPRSASFV